MILTIGPIKDGNLRSRIIEFARSRPQLFDEIGSQPGQIITRIYSKSMVDQYVLNTQPIEEVKSQFKSTFKRFMDNDFGEIVDVLAEKFAQASTG